MFKVLIVDDEDPVREAIKILGAWDTLEVGEILEACNADEGLALMSEHRPDIVLADMKMPGNDGTFLLKAIEAGYPETRCIVISGYDNFEYTRQAVKSRAEDYLLKPVNGKELNHSLAKAVENIREQRRKIREAIDTNLKLNLAMRSLKEDFLFSLIEGTLDESAQAEYANVIFSGGDKAYYGSAVLKILNMNEMNERFFDANMGLLSATICKMIEESGAPPLRSFCLRNPKVENEFIVILACEEASDGKAGSLSCDLMQRVAAGLKSRYGAKTIAAVSRFHLGFAMLKDSYQYAGNCLDKMNLLDLTEMVVLAEPEKPAGIFRSVLNIKNLIENAIDIGNMDFPASFIENHLGGIAESGYFSMKDAHKTIREVALMLHDIALEKGVPDQEIIRDVDQSVRPDAAVFYFADLETYQDLLSKIIGHYFQKIAQHKEYCRKFNVYEIKDYIDQNYSEEIKIAMFTEKYYLSRQYLMKLFKKEFNCGIYEYALKVRMEKAKELMNDPKIKIQSIAELLNYRDGNYFSKAFKSYFKISPSDYRMNLWNK